MTKEETTAGMMELDDVSPGELNFKEHLFASDYSLIFLVVIREQQCVIEQ